MRGAAPLTLKFDCGLQLPGEGALQIAVDLFTPPAGVTPRALLWCLPGGNMNRRYYDLIPPGDDATQIDTTFSRSEEHTSELQSLMRISYAVFCLKKKTVIKKSINTYKSSQYRT